MHCRTTSGIISLFTTVSARALLDISSLDIMVGGLSSFSSTSKFLGTNFHNKTTSVRTRGILSGFSKHTSAVMGSANTQIRSRKICLNSDAWHTIEDKERKKVVKSTYHRAHWKDCVSLLFCWYSTVGTGESWMEYFRYWKLRLVVPACSIYRFHFHPSQNTPGKIYLEKGRQMDWFKWTRIHRKCINLISLPIIANASNFKITVACICIMTTQYFCSVSIYDW